MADVSQELRTPPFAFKFFTDRFFYYSYSFVRPRNVGLEQLTNTLLLALVMQLLGVVRSFLHSYSSLSRRSQDQEEHALAEIMPCRK